MPHFHNPCLGGAGGQGGAYEIEQSLRFDGSSSYLSRTFGNDGSSRTWTYSGWIKKGSLNDRSQPVLAVGNSSGAQNSFFGVPGNWSIQNSTIPGGGLGGSTVWEGLRRDYSAWYHWVLQKRSSTANDFRLYINGVQLTTTNNSTTWNNFNRNITHYIGRDNYDPAFLGGHLAELHFVDNQILDHEDFGEFDENGLWRPIEVTGLTYGTNGFYLKFDPSATNGIGHDHSGNGNNWTATAFTTSGTGTDVMSDTPTTNWATLNPLWNPIEATYAEGNLKFTGGSTHSPSASSISASSGKFYFEATALSGSAAKWSLGIIDTAIKYRKSSGNNYIPGYTPNSVYSEGDAISLYDNNIYKNGSIVVSSPFSGGSVVAGDVVQMAVDIDAGEIWFGIDGIWNNGGGTEGAFNASSPDTTFTANDDYIFHFTAESCGWEVNFGQRAFEYTPPTGFNALNTSNLPAPDIADGSDYFQTDLDTGANILSSAQGIFSNGLWWIKDRDNSNQNQFVDSVRGGSLTLTSPNVQAETSYSTPSGSSVAWAWNTGTGTTTNTAGSIQSTVSANASAGFSIVSADTASSVTTATYGHGLGVAPSFMLVRPREGGAYHFFTYHKDIGAGQYIFLNGDGTPTTSSTIWNNTAPSSTVFTLGTLLPTDQGTSQGFIAYCFAEVEGYSKFGSYNGNGSTDGTFVYCGFRPAWVLIKVTNIGTTNWILFDSVRQTYNVIGPWLVPSLDIGEVDSAYIDFLSNGFKLRVTNNLVNSSSGTYIFAAFAENPFGGSGVSPATAR